MKLEALTFCSLCQRFGFVLFTDKAASAKRESSAAGTRNKRFRASKVCRIHFGSQWYSGSK